MLPFCDTCGRTVTLHEVESDAHSGHSFKVEEAAALNLVRLYCECERCKLKDTCATAPQLKARVAKLAE